MLSKMSTLFFRFLKILFWPLTGSSWFHRLCWFVIYAIFVGSMSTEVYGQKDLSVFWLVAFSVACGIDLCKLIYWQQLFESPTPIDIQEAEYEARTLALTECLMLVEPWKDKQASGAEIYQDILHLMSGEIRVQTSLPSNYTSTDINIAYNNGWAFAYRQWERTGSVPPPVQKV